MVCSTHLLRFLHCILAIGEESAASIEQDGLIGKGLTCEKHLTSGVNIAHHDWHVATWLAWTQGHRMYSNGPRAMGCFRPHADCIRDTSSC